MRKNNRLFDNGAVVVLYIICFGLLIILLMTVLDVERTEDGTAQNIHAGIIEDKEDIQGTLETIETSEMEESTEASDEMINAGNMEGTAVEDPSAIPEPDFYEFTVGDKTYFDDALFIGDSRTVGLKKYGTLDNADYFATTGLNLYKIFTTKMKTDEGQEILLDDMLQHQVYGKIYVMLGINELGYNFDTTVEKYREFLAYLFSLQPDAIVYVCANLHVNHLRNEVDEVHNNAAINRINEAIAGFADQKNIFYLDVNPMFDDEKGNLSDEYISDDSHLKGKHYEHWCNWYCENVIIK